MSVYIKIKEAQLPQEANPVKASLLISSKDNTLKTEAITNGSSLTWNACIISSSKEKKIIFQIKDDTANNQSYGKGELYYSSLRSYPQKQFSQTITLDNGGRLFIDVYYTQRQNFIGEIASYDYDNYVPKNIEEATTLVQTTKAESKRLFESPIKVASTPKAGLFTCCGDEGDDRMYTVEQDLSQPAANSPFQKELASNSRPTQGVQFYKGPCKSTNLFSCCDGGLQDQKFKVVEDYYRDK